MQYIYWDSNCFIGYLKGEEHGREARLGVMQAVERGEAKIVTSAFTLVEVVKFKTKNADAPEVILEGERIALENCFAPENGVIVVNVDQPTATKARQAVWDSNVDPKDAIHVGSAAQYAGLLSDDDEFVFQTFDKTLIKRAQGFAGIRFEEPSTSDYPYQATIELEEGSTSK